MRVRNEFYLGVLGIAASIAVGSKAAPTSNELFKNVQYVCPSYYLAYMDEPFKAPSERAPITEERKLQFLKNIRIYYETVVSAGIDHLKDINPKFADKVVTAFQNEKLTVSCQNAKQSPVAEFRAKGLFSKNEIHMGSSAWDVYTLAGKGDLSEKMVLDILQDQKKYGKAFNAVVVFHESLHFAKLDNLPAKKHNDLEKYGLGFGDDIVYSCACAAFTGQGWFPTEEREQAAIKTCESGVAEGERTGFTVLMDEKGLPLPPTPVNP